MKKIFLLLFFCSDCLIAFGQNDTARITIIGGVYSDECREVIELRSGGYIAIGTTASFGQGNTDIYLIKTDTGGLCLWSETIGESGIDRGYSVKETFDGGLIIAGYTNDYGAFGYDVFLARTDSSGILLWAKTFGGSDWDFGYSVQQTADSGFVVCGESYSFSNGDADVLVIKTDMNGNLTWIKHFGGLLADAGFAIIISRTGNYLIAGKTFSYGSGNSDAYIISINSSGDTLWTKTYGGTGTDATYAIDTTFDNGIIFTGVTNSFSAGDNDMYLVKLDSIGNLQWYRTPGGGGDDIGQSVIQCPDSGYITVGIGNSYGSGGYGMYMDRRNSTGDWQEGPTFGGIYDDYGYSVIRSANGSVMFGGTTQSYGNGADDVYLVKLPFDSIAHDYTLDIRICSDTPIVAGLNDYIPINSQLRVYPNPFHVWTEINFNISLSEISSLNFSVYDMLGEKVFESKNIKSGTFRFYRKNLKSGMYYFSITNNMVSVTKGKFLID